MEFDEIIKRLRIRLSNDNNMQKIYDKDIANALGLEAQYFAVMKKEKRYRLKKLQYFAIKIILASIGSYLNPIDNYNLHHDESVK